MGSSFLFPGRICEFFHSLTLFLVANEGLDSDLETFSPGWVFLSEDPIQLTETKRGMISLRGSEEGLLYKLILVCPSMFSAAHVSESPSHWLLPQQTPTALLVANTPS